MSISRSRPPRRTGLQGASTLPFSMKIVLENLLRNEDGRSVTKQDIEAVVDWLRHRGKEDYEIAFRPARVLMQDFTGVPAVVDLAAMRDAMVEARRRSRQDQPAGAGRSRDRPFRGGRLRRHVQGAGAERQARIRAEPGALPLPQMGTAGVLELLRRAAGHRHLPSGQPGISRPDRLDQEGQARRDWKSPIPTRWSAPIRTRPWSTAWPCSAGASAASRRKR